MKLDIEGLKLVLVSSYQLLSSCCSKFILRLLPKATRILLLFWVVCSSVVSIGAVSAADDNKTRISDAWKAVRSGNAVVLMRHALAPGFGDPTEFELADCSTQRNLSDDGRRQAVAIGEVLRDNGIVDASILSSQWCRCVETATLLRLGSPQTDAMLNSFFQDRQTADKQTQSLHEYLSQLLERKREVTVLVTHQVNIKALTGQFTDSGDMLIVTLRNDEIVVIARVSTE